MGKDAKRGKIPFGFSAACLIQVVFCILGFKGQEAFAPPAQSAAHSQVASPSSKPGIRVHPELEITICTGTAGTSSYVAGFALADLLNKKHPWLRAAVVETAQSADAAKMVAQDTKLHRTGIFSVNSIIHSDMVAGRGSFTAPIEYQVLALIRSDAMSMTTINPGIRTMSDLDGKRLSVGTKGGPGPVYEALLNAYKIKPAGIEYLSWEPAEEALIEGRIDAAAQTLGDTMLDPYVPPAVIKRLQARMGFHIISMDLGLIQKIAEQTPVGYVEIPSKVFGTPVVAIANRTSWGVCPEFDSEAAYEVVKFMAENAGSFKDYDPSLACIKKETLAEVASPPVVVHPSAAKYYRENGIWIGN